MYCSHLTAHMRIKRVRICGLIMLGVAALFSWFSVSALGHPIDQSNKTVQDTRSAFDVVSIKYSGSLVPGRVPKPIHFVGGRLACDETLARLITTAYGLKIWEYSPPLWQMTEYYEVKAIAPAGTSLASRDLMLQRMLEERLGLRYHRERKAMPIYALEVGKDGLKLQPGIVSDPNSAQKVSNGAFSSNAANLNDLSEFLTVMMDRPVLNATGLNGTYRMKFNWSEALRDARPRTAGTSETPQPLTSGLIDLVRAQNGLKQAGLRLNPRMSPLEQFVVDHVNVKPTPN